MISRFHSTELLRIRHPAVLLQSAYGPEKATSDWAGLANWEETQPALAIVFGCERCGGGSGTNIVAQGRISPNLFGFLQSSGVLAVLRRSILRLVAAHHFGEPLTNQVNHHSGDHLTKPVITELLTQNKRFFQCLIDFFVVRFPGRSGPVVRHLPALT